MGEELLFLCHHSNPTTISFLPLLSQLYWMEPHVWGLLCSEHCTAEQKDLVICAFGNCLQSLLKPVRVGGIVYVSVEIRDVKEKLCLLRDGDRF